MANDKSGQKKLAKAVITIIIVGIASFFGINVTDFLSVTNNMPNKNDFIARFNQFVNNSRVVRMKFSKNVKWFEWTKV